MQGCLDEFYIYDRVLTPGEVVWAYSHTDIRAAGKDVPAYLVAPNERLKVTVKPSPAHTNALVQVLVQGSQSTRGLHGNVVVDLPGTDISLPLALDGEHFAEITVDLNSAPGTPAVYGVTVTMTNSEGLVATGQGQLDWAGNPSWRGNDIGNLPLVSVGYSNITVNGHRFGCVGRDYWIGSNGLPQQITSAGFDLLTDPITLYIHTSQDEILSGTSTVSFVNNGKAAIAGQSSNQSVILNVSAEASFDGLLKYTLMLTPVGGSVDLQQMQLRMPLKSQFGELCFYGEYWAEHCGAVPPQMGTVLCNKFAPFMWSGDTRAGLMFMCESDEQFHNADPGAVYSFVRTTSGVEMRVSFVDKPFALSAPWRVTIGLQASPVRPLESDWRRWTLAVGNNWMLNSVTPTPDWMRYFGYPEATDTEHLNASLMQEISDAHMRGRLIVPYVHPNMLSEDAPEWKEFGQDWILSHPLYWDSLTGSGYGPIRGVSTGASDWRDFVVWKTQGFLTQYGFDGLYYDHTTPIECYNPLFGEGYNDATNGTHHTFNIFSKRELYRRLYNVVKSLPKNTFILGHACNQIPLPYLAFCDGYTCGEGFDGLNDAKFLDVHDLDYYRAMFCGRQWGCKPYWLGPYTDSVEGTIALRRARAFRNLHGHDYSLSRVSAGRFDR